MSEQTPLNEPQSNPNNPPEYRDARDQRRQERWARREERWSRRGGAWVGGAVLILLGVIFLLQNVGIFVTRNWWALFILIPAFGSFAAAWNSYQDAGHLDRTARGSLFGGLVLTAIAAFFLFGLSGTFFWPALLIVVGAGVLVNALVN